MYKCQLITHSDLPMLSFEWFPCVYSLIKSTQKIASVKFVSDPWCLLIDKIHKKKMPVLSLWVIPWCLLIDKIHKKIFIPIMYLFFFFKQIFPSQMVV